MKLAGCHDSSLEDGENEWQLVRRCQCSCFYACPFDSRAPTLTHTPGARRIDADQTCRRVQVPVPGSGPRPLDHAVKKRARAKARLETPSRPCQVSDDLFTGSTPPCSPDACPVAWLRVYKITRAPCEPFEHGYAAPVLVTFGSICVQAKAAIPVLPTCVALEPPSSNHAAADAWGADGTSMLIRAT